MAGRPRGRPRKIKSVNAQFAVVPKAIESLAKHKDVLMYLLTGNFEDPHNKIYFFVVWSAKKKQLLTRCWGPFGGTLQHSTDLFNQAAMQKLIEEKAAHGYKFIKDTEVDANEETFEQYCEEILNIIKLTAKII